VFGDHAEACMWPLRSGWAAGKPVRVSGSSPQQWDCHSSHLCCNSTPYNAAGEWWPGHSLLKETHTHDQHRITNRAMHQPLYRHISQLYTYMLFMLDYFNFCNVRNFVNTPWVLPPKLETPSNTAWERLPLLGLNKTNNKKMKGNFDSPL